MCGIAGILEFERRTDVECLDRMLPALAHRGPDDEGRLVDGPLAMGMRRLSIIDVPGGRQPIENEDGNLAVVLNGEIYNYVELTEELRARGHRFTTRSDTEVLVHLYEEFGLEFLERLNGMFALALWDKRAGRLVLARDRLGIKPLYVRRLPQGVAFASELKALLAGDARSRTLEPQAVLDYLTLQYIPGSATPYREYEKLLPGHLLVCEASGTTVQRWWSLADHCAPASLPRAEAVVRIRELFDDAVRLRMRSDVPVGAYLSGGLDSSLVTRAAAQLTDATFPTFNVAFEHTEFDESAYARELAELARTDHHQLTVSARDAIARLPQLVWHLDEPIGDSAFLPSFLVSQLAAEHVKVALSGLGADELFGGYHRYHRRIGRFEQLSRLPRRAARLLRPLVAARGEEWARRLDLMTDAEPWEVHLQKTHAFEPALNRALVEGDANLRVAARTRALHDGYPHDDFVNRAMFVDAHTYLPDQILALTDRMSMAVSLEARTPFLDHRLVELASSLPGDWKVRGSSWKSILKEALGDRVPASILTRPKWGFAAPVGSWIESQGLDPLKRLLGKSALVEAGVLDGDAMRTAVAHFERPGHRAEWLWALGVLEVWYRVFEGGSPGSAPALDLHQLAS